MNIKQMFLSFLLMLIMFNGFVWVKLFENQRDFYDEHMNELENHNILLQQELNKYTDGIKIEGIDVTVTMYHPTRGQTDSTPNILADGTQIKIHQASEYKYIAVSRNLLKRWGGWLDYGDFIVLTGTDGKDGVYQVRDTMNRRFVNRIDILESPGTKPYKFDSAKILKTDLNADFVSNEN